MGSILFFLASVFSYLELAKRYHLFPTSFAVSNSSFSGVTCLIFFHQGLNRQSSTFRLPWSFQLKCSVLLFASNKNQLKIQRIQRGLLHFVILKLAFPQHSCPLSSFKVSINSFLHEEE